MEEQFSKIAPYLGNFLVLAGFCLFLLSGTYRVLIRAGLFVPLSQKQSATFVGRILNHAFLVAILVIVLGFAYAGFRYHHAKPITQQSGPCSSNIVGDNNKTDINCADKTGGGKTK
jgi:uncharacterized membrane protein